MRARNLSKSTNSLLNAEDGPATAAKRGTKDEELGETFSVTLFKGGNLEDPEKIGPASLCILPMFDPASECFEAVYAFHPSLIRDRFLALFPCD